AKPSKLLRPTSIAASSVSNRERAASSWSPTATNQSPTSMTPSTVMAVVLISLAISSALRQDAPQLGREVIRTPRLSVFAAEESAVVAGEDPRLGAEPLGDGEGTAVRQLSLRLRTAR